MRVHSGSGAVAIDGVQGTLRVTTSSSGIAARNLRGDLTALSNSGRIEAFFAGSAATDVETQSSAIILRDVDGPVSLTTNSGEARIAGRPRDQWRVSTRSSRVEMTLEGVVSSFVFDLSTRSGSIDVGGIPVHGTVEKRRVDGAVGTGGPMIRVEGRSGSVRPQR